ncbi:L-cysteine desulfidase family protein [Mobilicoccus pelagius]|uniref:UPF0597 protein MOPEL_007_00940 n=1 Tax=Mobilicoccus pelagius NBRC 104925 TaxID=1089455 RepID=H5UNH0_9MICO|nr:L-serine ammonia-lyase, iron-sulfur-dependent, subunit alpha [Mobilicoccus pelagius]GAB47278.1 hypothetical protein MOPEL_007_00940 [Mobilicoccus pelagius NBRC 104925]
MNNERRAQLLAALNAGVRPATGCTEPVALALAAAEAARRLGEPVRRIEARLSANVLKNGMGVAVPGTGRRGLAIAAAAGALGGDPDAGLGVLADLDAGAAARAREMVDARDVRVGLAEEPYILWAEARVFGDEHSARVCIVGGHTDVVVIERDGVALLERPLPPPDTIDPHVELLTSSSLAEVVETALTADLAELSVADEADRLNMALVEAGRSGEYGLALGRNLLVAVDKGLASDDLANRMVALTAAASDARMGGAPLPAMTNAGSGNQGITVTVPVCVVADHVHATPEQRTRAIAMSHLAALYLHAHLPVLSGLCATTTAGMGAAVGMSWLLDGNLETADAAIRLMAADVMGMLCDGAGTGCANKVSSSVGSAYRAVVSAMAGSRMPYDEGIAGRDADETARFIGRLVRDGMTGTDREVLAIMRSKNA